MPSDAEFTTLELFTKVMQPLVQITEAIGAEKWVTISAVCPLLYKLLSVLFVIGEEDTSLEKSMKQAMHSNLSHHCTGDLLMMLNIATSLDPRFRALSFLSERDLLFFLQLRRKLWTLALHLAPRKMPQTVIKTDLHAQQMNLMNHAPYKKSQG